MSSSKVASMNPDSFIQGGLADDFDGVITKVRFCPWNYNGSIDHHVLAVAVTIRPDDEEEFTQYYSAGDLEQFVPSMDGENGVNLAAENAEPADLEGIYALRVGKKEGLASSSNWAQFIGAAVEANFPKDRITPDVTFFEGTRGHFNRIPQKKRSGLVQTKPEDGKNNRNKEILVLTEFKSFETTNGNGKAPAKAKAAAKTASTTSTSTTTASNGNGLDEKLAEIVRGALKKAGDDGMPKSALPKAALAGLSGADKAKGVKRIVEAEFLNAYDSFWAFDADSGTLISVE